MYHHVLFSNVDEELIASFIDNFDFNDFDIQIWNAISRRLRNPITQTTKEQNERYEQEFEKKFYPQYEDTFCGILSYLKSHYIDNVTNKISITASSLNSSCPPINVINYDSSNCFQTYNQQDSWICFDFIENKVIPTCYQIRSFNGRKNDNHPKSWVIEGSNGNNIWIIIDEQKNCSYLNDVHKTHIFKISSSNQFRMIRMRLTEANWANNQYLIINSFEIYGKLI